MQKKQVHFGWLVTGLFFACVCAHAQLVASHITWGTSLPITCSPFSGDVFFKTTAPVGVNQCLSPNTWTPIPVSVGTVSTITGPSWLTWTFNAGTYTATLTGVIPASGVGGFDGVTVSGSPSAGQVPIATSPTAATWQTPSAGTVNTIVGPSGFINWNLVSTTYTATWANQSANCGFFGPTTGSPAPPTCRALVLADLPTAIPNANLLNPSMTINSTTCTLGASCTPPSGSLGISVSNANVGTEPTLNFNPATCILQVGTVVSSQVNLQSSLDTTCLNPTFVSGSGTITVTAGQVYVHCTSTCAVSPPTPVQGLTVCAYNAVGVSTAITLSALGGSAQYSNQLRTAYGTAGTGTLSSTAAASNSVCVVGVDSTHYDVLSAMGTFTAS